MLVEHCFSPSRVMCQCARERGARERERERQRQRDHLRSTCEAATQLKCRQRHSEILESKLSKPIVVLALGLQGEDDATSHLPTHDQSSEFRIYDSFISEANDKAGLPASQSLIDLQRIRTRPTGHGCLESIARVSCLGRGLSLHWLWLW